MAIDEADKTKDAAGDQPLLIVNHLKQYFPI